MVQYTTGKTKRKREGDREKRKREAAPDSDVFGIEVSDTGQIYQGMVAYKIELSRNIPFYRREASSYCMSVSH